MDRPASELAVAEGLLQPGGGGVDHRGPAQGRQVVRGSFSAVVDCAAPSSRWSATVTPSSGRFRQGFATALASASACDASCASDTTTREVILRR